MGTNTTVEQNTSVSWGVIVLLTLILLVAWVGLYLMAAPIAGL
ncbi:MAG: hypothetical protein ABEI98_04455 [Halorhabdus sp.]